MSLAIIYGAQTARSLIHFKNWNGTNAPRTIRAFGILKKAAALTNRDLKLISAKSAGLIVRAANEVITGKWDDHFL